MCTMLRPYRLLFVNLLAYFRVRWITFRVSPWHQLRVHAGANFERQRVLKGRGERVAQDTVAS